MANLTYGDSLTIAVDEIPEASRVALMQYGLAHQLGNVVASATVNRIRNAIGDPKAPRDAVSAWREANKEQIALWTDELRAEVLQDIRAGTLGVREFAPRKDPVEKEFEGLILDYLKAALKSQNGLFSAMRKEPEKEFSVGGHTRTFATMVANAKASQHDRLFPIAQKNVQDRELLAKRAETETLDAEALGI